MKSAGLTGPTPGWTCLGTRRDEIGDPLPPGIPRKFFEKSEKSFCVILVGTAWTITGCRCKMVENGFSDFSHLRDDFFGPQTTRTDAEAGTEIPLHGQRNDCQRNGREDSFRDYPSEKFIFLA